MDVLETEGPVNDGLANFDVFHAVKLERFCHFAENAFGDFQPLRGQLVDFVFRLEIPRKCNKDRHDEPAKQTAQNKDPEVFELR